MKQDTYTFTARSAVNPNKVATFTFHNGDVSVELGNAIVEQATEAYEALTEDGPEKDLSAWIKPASTTAVQKLIEPISVADFDAETKDNALQATAWIRTGGLRLAPIMMTWHEVDNPEAAEAFVAELKNRKELLEDELTRPGLLDYWAGWIGIGLASVATPLILMKWWQKRRSS